MMKKIIAGIAAAALAVSAMATAAFAATETKTIDVDLYNGTGATMTKASYTATATVKLPAALTAVTGSTITSSVKAGDAVGPATLSKVTILGTEATGAGLVTASVLGTEANKFAKGTFTEVTVVYTFENTADDTAELTADQLTAVNTALKAATIELSATWKAGDEAIGTAWTSAAIGDTTAVKAFVTANAEAAVNKTFKLKAAEKAALLEAGAAKVVLTIVSESDYAAGVEQTATIGGATVKVKPAAATKTLTFETDLTALYSAEYGEWEDLIVTTTPACLTAKLAISYEVEAEETEETSADETDVTEDTSAEDTTAAPEDTSADDTTAPEDTSADDTTAEGDTGADAGEGEDGENGKGDNTETGVVLAVVPAIVAGAALVVSRKRK